MKIDWFTLSAQIVNFLILLVLLKRFLYKPILRAMETREQKFRARWEDVEQKEREAQETIDTHQRATKEMHENKRSMLSEAREQAEEERVVLLKQAREEVDKRKQRWSQQWEHEREAFLLDLRKTIGQQALAIARKALADLAERSLEQQILHNFLSQLQSLSQEQKKLLLSSIRDADHRIQLHSSFPLPEEDKERLAQRLQQQLDEGIELLFLEDPDLLCGIQLQSRERRLGWSIQDYLQELEGHFAQEPWSITPQDAA